MRQYVDVRVSRPRARRTRHRPTVTSFYTSKGDPSIFGHKRWRRRSASTSGPVTAVATSTNARVSPRVVPRRIVRRHHPGSRSRRALSRAARRAVRTGASRQARAQRRAEARAAARVVSRHPVVTRIRRASAALSRGRLPALKISSAELATIPKAELKAMLSEYRSMHGKLDKLYARKVNKIKALHKQYETAQSVSALSKELTDVRAQIRAIKNAAAPRFAQENESDEAEEEDDETHSNLSAVVSATLGEANAAPRFEQTAAADEEHEGDAEGEEEQDEEEEEDSDASEERAAAKQELLHAAATQLHGKDEASLLVRMKALIDA